MHPFPEPADLLACYDDRDHSPVHPADDPSREAPVHRVRFDEELDRIEAFARRGRILDIGCAWGFFLDRCKRRGWDVQGVELSSVEARYARQRFGIEVFEGPLADAGFPDRHFDAVTLWHVFEHISDPLATLVEIRRILKPGGVAVIAVPTPISAPDYVFDAVPLHLFYFDGTTLARAIRQAGFRSIRTRKGGGTGGAALMRKAGIRDPRSLISRHVTLLWPLKKILQHARSAAELHKEITVYAVPEQTA
ncbi:MAG TPA: class I SAM-dependent methyltransferase [Syntrophales bacterium]|nr:class I SAM-dependent methyltransferase [Syntrophobacterales bacterium]HQL90889.1 class I SAM-dependent methyltransferase [Syntrophales bacterium]